MAGKLLLQSSLLSLESVGLGWFIVDVKNPQRRYHDPFPGQKLRATTIKESGWKEVARQVEGSKAGIRLTEFLALFAESRTDDTIKAQTALATTYTLHQWEDTFKDACGLTVTRRWLEDAIADGKDVYFIVGYRTFLDADLEEQAQIIKGRERALRLPVSALGPQIGGGIIDPSLVRHTLEEGESKRSWGVMGECVYAVHYCRVNFKWMSSRKIDSSTLGKNKWRIYLGLRGGEEDEDEMDDNVVEAGLEDPCDFDFDDILLSDGDYPSVR